MWKEQRVSGHISSEIPTLVSCLQEMRKRLEEHHDGCAEVFAKITAASPARYTKCDPDNDVDRSGQKPRKSDKKPQTKPQTVSSQVALDTEQEKDTVLKEKFTGWNRSCKSRVLEHNLQLFCFSMYRDTM